MSEFQSMKIHPGVLLAYLTCLLCAALWPLQFRQEASAAPQSGRAELLSPHWLPERAELRRLPLSPVEQRFARQFPGQIAHFSDGRRQWVVRVTERPTRMLHPASDCFRGMGYRVDTPHVRMDADGKPWRCFGAVRDGRTLQVCEHILDGRNHVWTDTSSWYWAVLLDRSPDGQGPWWAVTRVEVGV